MYFDENTVLFLNGKWLKAKETSITPYVQTLHYGNGVFEGIRSYKTQNGTSIFKAKEHYKRLYKSCQKIHIKFDYNIDRLIGITYELLRINRLSDAYIRPLVFFETDMMLRMTGKPSFAIIAWEWKGYFNYGQLRIKTAKFRKPNPNTYLPTAKITGYYINSILALQEAKRKGYDGAVWIDQAGYVTGGADGNFFFQKNGKLYTAPLGNIFPGITRETVFELAKKLDIEIIEKHFRPEEVYGTEGAFFTGTDNEIVGIKEYDNAAFQLAWTETLGYELAMAYKQLVKGENGVIEF